MKKAHCPKCSSVNLYPWEKVIWRMNNEPKYMQGVRRTNYLD